MDGLNIRMEIKEERISELKGRSTEIIQSKKQKDWFFLKKRKKKRKSLRKLWDNLKRPNMYIWVPEGQKREKTAGKNMEEMMTEHFGNLPKDKFTDPRSSVNLHQDKLKEKSHLDIS